MYKITQEQLNILIQYFTQGSGAQLPYGEVAQIVKLLSELEEVEDNNE